MGSGAIILLTFFTFIAVLAGAVMDMRATDRSISGRKHSTLTTPGTTPMP
jgi:hypothetical protein